MPASLDTAHQIITNLAQRFESGKGHYLAPTYSEAQVRTDFIDKFFAALDWDVSHNEQTNPAEQEVKIERGVTVQGIQKRADYAFYFSPNFRDVRFFVEAKKPSVDLNTNADAYFQTLRYGWNAQTPLAVLTDFEQFHILDCRAKPDIRTALQRAHKTYRYTDFLDKEKFAEVYWLFSREALAAGAFDRYITALPKLKAVGKQMGLLRTSVQPVDASFLDELEQHRETLAKSFKRDNPQLDGFALTEVTQRVLDRLVFLRFLEDKQIETEVSVASFARSAAPWAEFVADSRKLNTRYNGAVYKPHSLIDNRRLTVSDDDFRDVCEQLSDKHSPYDFNAIPIHILGSIYERFLGKVIVATDKRAKVEEKPEVRKAGGVYYTPEYIVRYIVDQTVGKLIEGKTPAEIAKLRFADIACGSGSFLLGVYDTLLRYHTRWFNEHPDKAERAGCIKTEDDSWRLSLRQRRDILTNNVYGVDIDRQAVEVTQVSLYLKLLEDETTASSHQFEIQFHDTLLPSLSDNIKCGNSLIGTDILSGQIFTTDEERALNAMDFEDAFPVVMKAGGFDAIVGNPPYGALLEAHAEYYLRSRFVTASGSLDTYGLFIERCIAILKPFGYTALIVPTGWYSGVNFSRLRKFFVSECDPISFVNLPYDVFKDAWVDTTVFVAQKRKNAVEWRRSDNLDVQLKTFPKRHRISDAQEFFDNVSTAKIGKWFADGKDEFLTYSDSASTAVITRMQENGVGFSSLADIQRGVTPFAPKSSPFHKNCRPAFTGTVRRYSFEAGEPAWIRYDESLAEYKPHRYFEGSRLLLRELISRQFRLQSVLVTDDFVTNKSMQSILSLKNELRLEYLLGILNSKLMSWYFLKRSNVGQRDDFPKIVLKETRQLPIRPINFDDPQDKAKHDRMVQLVTQMLDSRQKQTGAQTDHDRDYYEQRCTRLDRQIDALVYDLYGLTEDEIAIVESQK